LNAKTSWNPFEEPSSFEYQISGEEIFNSSFNQIPSNDNGKKLFA